MRRGGLLALVVLVAGCGIFTKPADTVKFDRGQAIALYAEAKASIRVLQLRIAEACAAKKLKADACATAGRIGDQLSSVDREIQVSLSDPGHEVDVERVIKAIELVAKLAGAAL